ncbi:serine/threonine-protein kinase [Amycolatopsis nalaikhensis]|uniref:Protein kinase n=1 Tax=Amycolatopsis nalaikhensis TaxID=715472 RepID=A0ABY8XBD2_9PSEU|nr:serine/threonine-protein kinase [Amycolatopsis sp. 2-2]WIV53709.1 protein kinase [Amycolatopsis sp. 2-2]
MSDDTCPRFSLGDFPLTPGRAPHEERPPGLLAGRYEVGRLIGSGGTARVYRAYDVQLAREVAVKIYDRDAVALDQRRRLREMSIQGSIAHPGVVALLDSGTEHGRTYLVMQLVEGENLAERLLCGPMPAEEVTALADGLASALAHVHARRVVHRDLKPANVFLSADGPLIGDFGIAHALDTTHITGTGVVPGTAAYLAPEQVSGEPAGPPADVYALGLILLECVTGRREYAGTMVEAAMARLTRPPRIPDELPPSLAHTLRRMTQRDPADRPRAEEVRKLLHAPPPTLRAAVADGGRWLRRRQLASRGGASGSTPEHEHLKASRRAQRLESGAATTLSPAPQRRRRLMAVTGLAAVCVALLAVFMLAGQETGTPAQSPASVPAPTGTTPSSSAPIAGPATETPQPPVTASASLEPAAVTRAPSSGTPAKPDAGKPENRGKSGGKGKGPGHDS